MLKVLRPALGRILTPVGHLLARTPVTPNALTIIGTIGMSAGALTLFPTGHLFVGVVVCTCFVLTDMLDGTLARIKGTTGKFGAFLDSTMDRVADASVFAGLAIWFVLGGHDKVLAAVSLFCLVSGSLVSYAKARAESLGLSCDVGFAERTERLLIGLVAAGLSGLGVPYILPIGLWFLAAASAFTFGQRVFAARRSAAELAASQDDAGVSGSGTSVSRSGTGAGPADAGIGRSDAGASRSDQVDLAAGDAASADHGPAQTGPSAGAGPDAGGTTNGAASHTASQRESAPGG